jgi:hypothetical protein
MLSWYEIDRRCAGLALKAGAPTPGHSAAEGAVGADSVTDDAERRRRRVQHEADPYADPAEVPEVAHADLAKRFDQAYDTPDGYPRLRPVHPEQFRRGPITGGEAAYSPGYEAPARPVPVPSATLAPGMISRPLITGGQSRPCAPEGR